MTRSFPPDVIVLDTETLLHARFAPGKESVRIVSAKSYRFAADTFTLSTVTPQLTNPEGLADTLRRLKNETGRWEKVSLLLPDSWFRINLIDLPSLPDRDLEALEVVRWSLKRTLPISPEDLRVTYSVLSRGETGVRVLVLSAMEATLSAIEKTFIHTGFDVVLIEPVGLNLWNSIAIREPDTTEDRILVHLREKDFTTAVFRGSEPLFIRSRNLGGERTVEQEIRLSATYLRDSLGIESFASCHVAGENAQALHEILASELNTPVREVILREHVEEVPFGVSGLDAELTACTGVFTT